MVKMEYKRSITDILSRKPGKIMSIGKPIFIAYDITPNSPSKTNALVTESGFYEAEGENFETESEEEDYLNSLRIMVLQPSEVAGKHYLEHDLKNLDEEKIISELDDMVLQSRKKRKAVVNQYQLSDYKVAVLYANALNPKGYIGADINDNGLFQLINDNQIPRGFTTIRNTEEERGQKYFLYIILNQGSGFSQTYLAKIRQSGIIAIEDEDEEKVYNKYSITEIKPSLYDSALAAQHGVRTLSEAPPVPNLDEELEQN